MPSQTVPLTFSTSSNPGRYGHDGTARLLNAYAEARGPEGRAQFPHYAIDGLAAFGTITGGGAIRAMLAIDDRLYGVAGRLIFSCDQAGTTAILGGLASDGHVYMARNRRSPNPQIAVVCDGLYSMISGGVVTEPSDSDLPPPSSVTHIDGYFVFSVPNGRMYSSAIDDGTDINALDFTAAEANPDGLAMVTTRGRELLGVGYRSIEFWSNVGGSEFPFQRANSIEVGTLSGKSVATVDQTVAFVAHDGTVRLLDGYTAQRISNHAVERFIADTTDKATLTATAWSDRGHTFYCLSSPSGTWTYDLTTQFWHERKSHNLDRWRVSCVERFGDRLVAGHYDTGTLYSMSPDTYSEGSDPILWELRAPIMHAQPGRLVMHKLDLDLIPGVGLADGATEDMDPQIMLDTSEDGGLTFGGERMISVGTINQRLTRVSAHRLGLVRPSGRTVRLRMSANVVRGLTGASASLTRLG